MSEIKRNLGGHWKMAVASLLSLATVLLVLFLIQDKKTENTHGAVDACIVGCMDYRFNSILANFTKEQGYTRVDWVRVAGGAKDLDDPPKNTTNPDLRVIQKYLLKQIEISIKFHQAKRVLLIEHIDCLAYGGEKKEAFYNTELQRIALSVKKNLQSKNINIPISTHLAKFDKVYEAK